MVIDALCQAELARCYDIKGSDCEAIPVFRSQAAF